MPSARSYCGRQPSSRSARSMRLQAPAASPGRRAASRTPTGRPVTRLNASSSSRTVVPVPVPRLMAVAGPGSASNRVSAATCAAARSHTCT